MVNGWTLPFVVVVRVRSLKSALREDRAIGGWVGRCDVSLGEGALGPVAGRAVMS